MPEPYTVEVTVSVEVRTEADLIAAARQHYVDENQSSEAAAEAADLIRDPLSALIQLIDPTSLPGCKVLGTDADSE